MLKRISKILWGIIPAALLLFVLIVFTSHSDAAIWRAFSVIMPLVGIDFCAAVVVTVLSNSPSDK